MRLRSTGQIVTVKASEVARGRSLAVNVKGAPAAKGVGSSAANPQAATDRSVTVEAGRGGLGVTTRGEPTRSGGTVGVTTRSGRSLGVETGTDSRAIDVEEGAAAPYPSREERPFRPPAAP